MTGQTGDTFTRGDGGEILGFGRALRLQFSGYRARLPHLVQSASLDHKV